MLEYDKTNLYDHMDDVCNSNDVTKILVGTNYKDLLEAHGKPDLYPIEIEYVDMEEVIMFETD